MKIGYIVCSLDHETGMVNRVHELFTEIERAVNRAIVITQDGSGNPARYESGYIELIRAVITSDLNRNGEFQDKELGVAVFARTIDKL